MVWIRPRNATPSNTVLLPVLGRGSRDVKGTLRERGRDGAKGKGEKRREKGGERRLCVRGQRYRHFFFPYFQS